MADGHGWKEGGRVNVPSNLHVTRVARRSVPLSFSFYVQTVKEKDSSVRGRSLPVTRTKPNDMSTRLCRPSEEDRSVQSEMISHFINYFI